MNQLAKKSDNPLPKEIFKKGLELHHYANTAYPLNGTKVFKPFRTPNNEINQAATDTWQKVDELGLYIHIPFCKKRCLYCEYTVLPENTEELHENYVQLVLKEISLYKQLIQNKKTVGLDIGGGTPTALSLKNIDNLVSAVLKNQILDEKFDISIETTPYIAATEPEKIKQLKQIGINRISMGVQSIDPKILEEVGRIDNKTKILKQATENIRNADFKRFNVDIMYGFANQSIESWLATVQFTVDLDPEYITFYRNRYKGTRIEHDSKIVTLDEVNRQYDLAFDFLATKGYKENFGKNTFSKVKGDPGTSAYLTKRVIEGTPYLGLGLGAQSFSDTILSYNLGAASKKLNKYQERLNNNQFPLQDIYQIPTDEVMAKTICVSFYFGYINKQSFKKKFNENLENIFKEEVN
ncbi:radical SAM protein, partial [Candidatus Woesearchaeota archaeon]|nr:radical SAM protein [Candidatus Woesearchaeota archaeon]